MNSNLGVDVQAIMNSLSDGVYVCDDERRIVYWSQSAERITGWTSEDVVGRQCFDNLLCHVDKDGHKLCGEEYCPLHRAIITDTGSKGSLLVYAMGKNGAHPDAGQRIAHARRAWTSAWRCRDLSRRVGHGAGPGACEGDSTVGPDTSIAP